MSLIRSRYSWPTGRLRIVSDDTPLLIAAESFSITGTMVADTVTVSVTPATLIVTSTTVSWASWTITSLVILAMPDRSYVIVQRPGGSAWSR